MKLNLTVDEALSTTRAVRKRLDFDRPVEPEIIRECLEAAVQSPTGSNSQSWEWMVITDQAQRSALADLYRQGWEIYVQMEGNVATAYKGDDPSRLAQQDRVASSAQYLSDNFEKAPVMMIPLLPGRFEGLPSMAVAAMMGSILPGAWSFMIAARERGLGTAWTTIHLMFEQQAAEILGIDYESYTQCALITCGYTHGTEFKPASRPPIETVLHWDRWEGKAPW